MPTYGEKWRADGSACETGHVPRSCQTTFLRLDSTGEVSSVGNGSLPTKTRVSCTPPREVNGNMITMKNWVTSSVLGVNGLRSSNNFTNTGKSSHVDFNANILDRIADSIPVTASNMNPKMPKCPNNVLYSQGGTPGWNHPRQNFGVVNGRLPVFPCHQFNGPFRLYSQFGGVPHQGKMDMYACPEYLASMGKWTQPQMMEDHHWHQRHQKFDRAYRGHASKHYKHDHAKHDKKTFPSERVPSKCHGKGKQNRNVSREKSKSPVEAFVECNKMIGDQYSNSSSVSTPSTANIKCKIQVKPDKVKSSSEKKKYDVQKYNSVPGKIEPEGNALVSNNDNINPDIDDKKQLKFRENQELDTEVTAKVAKPCESLSDVNGENSKVSDHNDRLESNLQVLFVRKNWKKGRPSSSKQRRRKLQKAKTAECGNSASDSTDSEKVNDTKSKHIPNSDRSGRCHGTMAFILGLAQSPTSENMPKSPSCSSFVLSFSDDEDDDDESDFDDAEWETEFSSLGPCGLFNFIPQSNSGSNSPINFHVQISPVPSVCNTQEKTMDDINSTWDIQVSRLEEQEKCKSKKKTSKKVHFAKDKDLSVVHPMVTWAYAYQQARKGHWEKYGRDSDRFKRRVADLETILNPVLCPKHRKAIYVERFQRETN